MQSDRNQCERVATDLLDLVHGELSPMRTVEVEGHLDLCERCRSELTAVEHDLGLYRTADPAAQAKARVDLTARIAADLEGVPRRRFGVPSAWLGVAVVGAAAVMAVVFDAGVPGLPPDAPPPERAAQAPVIDAAPRAPTAPAPRAVPAADDPSATDAEPQLDETDVDVVPTYLAAFEAAEPAETYATAAGDLDEASWQEVMNELADEFGEPGPGFAERIDWVTGARIVSTRLG